MPKPPIASTPEETAAAWRARLSADQVGAPDRVAFEAWRGANPDNAAAWEQVQEVWSLSSGLADDPSVRRLIASAPSPSKSPPWSMIAASAAAVAGLCVLVGVTVGAPRIRNLAPSHVVAARVQEVWTTGPRGSSSRILPDGSHVVLLNGAVFAPAVGGGRRGGTLLSGEAAFEVAHDAGHPFVVDAAGHTVTALGTLFSVDARTSDTRVVLRRGSVRVAGGARSVVLRPGQQVVASSGPSGWRTSKVDAERALAWADDRVAFHGATLAEIVREMNLRSDVRLELGGGLSKERFSGTFRNGDVQGLAQALTTSGRARPLPASAGTLRLGAP